MLRILVIFFSFVIGTGYLTRVYGQEIAEAITITSDRMELDQKKNTVLYMGNVVTVRGNVIMKSDTLTATYNPEMTRVTEVVAEGNLEMTQGNRIATGTKAIFNSDDNSIVLTGNPVIRQGNSQVSGSRIILFLNEERGVVEGGSQRVKAVIFPDALTSKTQAQSGSEPNKN